MIWTNVTKIAAAAIVPTLMGLASNPAVRRAVKNVAKEVGIRSLKRIQQRRQRKGRRVGVLFPRMIPPVPRSNPTFNGRMVAAPVRITTQTTGITPNQQIVDSGSMLISTMSSKGDTNGNISWKELVMNPADVEMSERTARLSALYQKFNLARATFRYSPIKGTNANGNVNLYYTPNANDSPPPTLSDASGYGGFLSGGVAQPLQLDVSRASMNKALQYMFTQVTTTTDFQNNGGKLFYALSGCDTTQDYVSYGYLYLDYTIRFSDPKLAQSDVLSGAVEFDNGSAVTPIDLTDLHSGNPIFLESSVAGVYKRRGRRASYMIVHNHYTTGLAYHGGQTPDVLADLTPVLQVNDTVNDLISVFELPAGDFYVSIHSLNPNAETGKVWLFPRVL